MDELAPFRAAILRLLTNWGKSANRAQLDQWAKAAQKWPVGQVEAAVDVCIEDTNRTFEPKGFGEFARYLPSLRQESRTIAWYGSDGEWGGDWSSVPKSRWLLVAGLFRASLPVMDPGHRLRAEEFLQRARRHVHANDVEAAAKAHLAGGLDRFVEAWRTARKTVHPDQEAFGV